MESITLFDWLVFNWGLPCLSPSKNQLNKQIISVVLLSVLEGVYTWNFIPGWNSSRAEIIPVYGEMSLTVYTFLPRWNFILAWTHPWQKDRDEISSQEEKKMHFIPGWNFKMSILFLMFLTYVFKYAFQSWRVWT